VIVTAAELQFTVVQHPPGLADQGRPGGLDPSRYRGATYSTEVQQRDLTATRDHRYRHRQIAGTKAKRAAVPLVREEEAVPA
jgi:hypothetical protein